VKTPKGSTFRCSLARWTLLVPISQLPILSLLLSRFFQQSVAVSKGNVKRQRKHCRKDGHDAIDSFSSSVFAREAFRTYSTIDLNGSDGSWCVFVNCCPSSKPLHSFGERKGAPSRHFWQGRNFDEADSTIHYTPSKLMQSRPLHS